MAVELLPDAEQLVSAYLRANADITAVVAQRVYTEIPNDPTFPLVRLTRVGGVPVTQRPLHLDVATIQFDCYGGPKKTAQNIAQTIRAVLSAPAFIGGHAPLGVVSAVNWGVFAYVPDDTYTPAKPRYVVDADIYLHP